MVNEFSSGPYILTSELHVYDCIAISAKKQKNKQMFGKPRGRWANIISTLGERVVLAGLFVNKVVFSLFPPDLTWCHFHEFVDTSDPHGCLLMSPISGGCQT